MFIRVIGCLLKLHTSQAPRAADKAGSHLALLRTPSSDTLVRLSRICQSLPLDRDIRCRLRAARPEFTVHRTSSLRRTGSRGKALGIAASKDGTVVVMLPTISLAPADVDTTWVGMP